MLKNHEILEVTNGKLILSGLGSVGFGLEPMPGNAGVYPITAIINGNTSEPLRIVDGSIYKQASSISNVVVDVLDGGGRNGDKWRLILKELSTDGRERQFPTNPRGQLIVAASSETVLFDLDSRNDIAPFLALFGGDVGNGPFSVAADSPTVFRTGWGNPWDVSSFSRVLFGLEAHATDIALHAPPTLSALVQGLGRPNGQKPLTSATFGTVNDFGSGGGTWNGEAGMVLLGGSDVETSTSYTRLSPKPPPYVQFSLFTAQNLTVKNSLEVGDYWLRLYAVGLHT